MTPHTGQNLWRSLDEVADTEEFRRFITEEFPAHAPELLSGSSRRQFLKVMGASLALAGMGGLTGCLRYPEEKILPFATRPEGWVPGVPVHFASAFERDGVATGILATSFDGRPIKVDGNPEHPTSLGALDLLGQASVLDLYDPARSRGVVSAGSESSWSAARDALRAAAAAGGLAVLAPSSSSLTLARLRTRLLAQVPGARWFEYVPLSRDAEREGTRLLFGAPHRPIYDFSRARAVLALDADPLMTHPGALLHSRGFAAARVARRTEGTGHRLTSFESVHSITGSVADLRTPVRQREVVLVAARIALALELPGLPGDVRSALAAAGAPTPEEGRIAADLKAAGAAALVIPGDRQPAEVHALAHLINVSLGASGGTVRYAPEPEAERTGHADQIAAFVAALRDGSAKSVLVLGGNPVFDAPADLDLAGALARVPQRFRLGLHQDETSQACGWHLPEAHYLESWSDARAWDGTITLGQPLIEPLYAGRTAAEVVGLLVDETPLSAYDLVRETLRPLARGDFETFWRESIHRGFVENSAFETRRPDPRGGWGNALGARISAGGGDELEIVFAADHSLHDGRHANNGWLQECPDPMTKIAWDNAAILSPRDAERLGLKNGDLVRVTAGGKSLAIAAFVMPGQAAGSVTLPVGYGREVFDRVAGGVSYNLAKGSGVDVYPLRTAQALRDGSLRGAIERAGGKYKLATTQDHWAIGTLQEKESERRASEFARVVDLAEYRAKGGAAVAEFATHTPHLESLWDEKKYEGARWGMSIDLDLCTGCTACVVACQAENNIAVTGKDEVARGREMHWIRIDRYFRGDDYDAPEVVHQPLTCHHCENAPCEQVCPVAATTHSAEGLNDMAYNRCIGTRYCSNNCPYKVRRFNWFNNAKQKHLTEQEKMVYNPDVTVRSRGVMEKCTYCVQRINRVKITAKNAGRAVQDGEMIPACAQTCPTRAITFGDLADPASAVSREQASDRAYTMLEQLNVKPRTRYLARVVNTPGEGS